MVGVWEPSLLVLVPQFPAPLGEEGSIFSTAGWARGSDCPLRVGKGQGRSTRRCESEPRGGTRAVADVKTPRRDLGTGLRRGWYAGGFVG